MYPKPQHKMELRDQVHGPATILIGEKHQFALNRRLDWFRAVLGALDK